MTRRCRRVPNPSRQRYDAGVVPRRLLNLLTVLSLAFLTAWVLLSLLSCVVPAGTERRGPTGRSGFTLRDGELRAWSQVPVTPRNRNRLPYRVLIPQWEWGGIMARCGQRPPGVLRCEVQLSFWVVAAIGGFLPACRLAARRWRSIRADARIVRSLCQACGYDMRGCINHTCPECGTVK